MTEPLRVGIAVECRVCHRTKAPRGRSVPLAMYRCESDCPGYRQDPSPGSLWPGETSDEFGYPVGPDGTVERAREATLDDSSLWDGSGWEDELEDIL